MKNTQKSNTEKALLVIKNHSLGSRLVQDIQRSIQRLMKPLPYENLKYKYYTTADGKIFCAKEIQGNSVLKYLELRYVRPNERDSVGVFLKLKNEDTKFRYVSEILASTYYGIKQYPFKVIFRDGNRENLHKNNVTWALDKKAELFHVLSDDEWKRIESVVESISNNEYRKLKNRIFYAKDRQAEINIILKEKQINQN